MIMQGAREPKRARNERWEVSAVKRLTGALVLACLAVPISMGQSAANATNPNSDDYVARIAGRAATGGGALSFLQALTDSVGGRVTGTSQSQAAADLILKALKDAGFDSAHFEEYELQSRWRRGPATARVISPVDAPLVMGSYGWVPGTAGRVEVSLIDLGSPPSNDLPVPAEKVRGTAAIVDVHSIGTQPAQVMRTLLARQLGRAGAVAMLIPSDKPGRMLFTSAFGFYPHGPLPVLSVSNEDTLFLRRLVSKGAVKVSLDIANAFDSLATERNVVAELPGMNPKEVVLVGAHFDSWDYAQGADDNGSGVAALVDAARILKSLGVKPKCTIRFLFFSGEEQGELGSRAYVQQHKAELDHFRMFLTMDEGAQPAVGFGAFREDVVTPLQRLFQPLTSLGAGKVHVQAALDSDDASFMVAGVPTLRLEVEPADYDIRHHAVTDTFDKINPRTLAADTAVVAVAAWLIASAEEAPTRRLTNTEVAELLRKAGLDKSSLILFGPSEH